jgi:hypothetical protein
MRKKVQFVMDACLNVSCTNAIYKHIYHGEYTNMYVMFKCCQNIFVDKIRKKHFNFFSQHVNLSRHVMIKILFLIPQYEGNKKLYDDMVCYSTSY